MRVLILVGAVFTSGFCAHAQSAPDLTSPGTSDGVSVASSTRPGEAPLPAGTTASSFPDRKAPDFDPSAPVTSSSSTAAAAPPNFEADASGALSTGEVVLPMVKTLVALSIVLLLVWLTLHKGMGRLVERAQAGKRMRVVERVALDARRSLFLVELDGRSFVIGGGDLVRLDAQAPSFDVVAGQTGRDDGFARVLASTPRSSSASSPTSSPAAAVSSSEVA
jgi:flagellar protein FliO/FliZ